MTGRLARAAFLAAALVPAGAASAQPTRDLGLPPPSGSQNPVLPPPSGSQNPALPPATGQRYLPGIGGRFGDGPRRPAVPSPTRGADRDVQSSLSPASTAPAGPLRAVAEIGPALSRCWSLPAPEQGAADSVARVRFSVRRDGSLFGQPRVSWEAGEAAAGYRESFLASITRAVRRCTPLRLSRDLGESIAGRPLSIRFHGRAPSTERPN